MGIFRRTIDKKTNKEKPPRVNFQRWMDYTRLKASSSAMIDFISSLSVDLKIKPTQSEHLESAMARLHLTETMIQARKSAFLKLFLLIFIITTCTFAYSLYLLFTQAYFGAMVGTSASLVGLALSFRYHFWYIQLKHRKLGLSLREWWNIGILGGKK